MFKNIILIALRNFKRQKIHTIVNLGGLSLGISTALIIYLMLTFLFSYDRYHRNFNNIHRLVTESEKANGAGKDYTPGVQIVFPEAFKNDFPEVKDQVFISNKEGGIILIDVERKFNEETGIAYTDGAFFRIFDRKLLKGNPEKILQDPNKVVLSKKFAEKYFKNEDPIGKTFQIDFKRELMVEGIMEDYPENTDFQFDMLIAYSTVRKEWEKDQGWGSVSSDDQLYILLDEKTSPQQIEAGLPAFINKYFKEHNDDNSIITLQPLSELHFNTELSNFSYKTMSKDTLLVMAIIGIFLLVTSCVNFINLSTALAVKRSKEVGIRKVMGSSKRILLVQLLGETAFLVFLSILIAFCLAEVGLLYLNPLIGKSISIFSTELLQLAIFLLLLFIGLTLLAGLYPAQLISSFKPIHSLKNSMSNTQTGGKKLRQGLVVFQFVISQVFIIGTIVIGQQHEFLKTADVGFNREAVLTVDLGEENPIRAKSFKAEVQQLKEVEKISLAYRPPMSGSVSATNFYFPSNPGDYSTEYKLADSDYLPTYELRLLAGENLSESDTVKDFLINESLMKMIGITEPQKAVGESIKMWGTEGLIKGVIEDFNTKSLRNQIDPVLITTQASRYEIAAVKVAFLNINAGIKEIEKIYKSLYPEYDFSYSFLNEDIEKFYEREEKMSTMASIFASIAIFIGMLGLYGLIAYLTEIKTKEI
ncbi:MAG: ABC transporter permease, partial [Bacteroidota bacterium]